jgi:hypothetical protein
MTFVITTGDRDATKTWLAAHNSALAARPTEAAFLHAPPVFFSGALRAGHFLRRRVRYFKISVDFRTFNNRRLLETGPAAVRKTLGVMHQDTNEIHIYNIDLLFRS